MNMMENAVLPVSQSGSVVVEVGTQHFKKHGEKPTVTANFTSENIWMRKDLGEIWGIDEATTIYHQWLGYKGRSHSWECP